MPARVRMPDNKLQNKQNNLTRRTSKAIFWSSSSMMSTRAIQTLTTLVLARLLVPDDFGLIAVALVVINTLSLFRDMGLSQALIHRRDDIAIAADTTFLIVPLFGLLWAAMAVAAAPLVASFFNISEASTIIRILSLSLIFSSFGIVPATIMERDLSFRRKFIPDVFPFVGYSVVTLSMAARGFGVWSLVTGELVRNLLLSITIWPFTSWRPKFRFRRQVAIELLSYGHHIVGAAIAIFFFTTLDNATIAKALGPDDLGFYVLAFTIGTLPASQISMSFAKVLFPAYSSIQKNKPALARAFLKAASYVSAIAAPIAFGTLALGPVFLSSFYGDKWEGSVLPLQILTLYGFFRAIGGTAGEILKSTGKPRLLARISYFQLAFAAVLVYPAVTLGGLAGISLLFTTAIFLGGVAAVRLASSTLEVPMATASSRILIPVPAAFVAASLSWTVSAVILDGKSSIALVSGFAVYVATYIAVLAITRRSLLVDIYGLLRGVIASSAE